jgi:phytoene synthase
MNLADGYRHCRIITKKKARNFYYAFLFLPRPKREALYAVYAFCHSCDSVADGELSVDQKITMLNGYLEDLRRIERGEEVDDAVFVALADTIRRYRIPRSYFEELVDGVMMDLGTDSYATLEELKGYCHKVAGVVGLMVLEILGYRSEEAKRHAETLALAMQLTNILRDLREDAELRRVYLPEEDMRRFGYTREELFRGETNRAFHALMEFETERAHRCFRDAKPLFRLIPRRARYCPRMIAALYLGILRKIKRSRYDVFSRNITLNGGEKWGLAAGVFLRNALLP